VDPSIIGDLGIGHDTCIEFTHVRCAAIWAHHTPYFAIVTAPKYERSRTCGRQLEKASSV
jgi:hypothetical protein